MMWYLIQKGKRVGPLSDMGMRALLAGRAISGTTLVWKEGMDDWLPFAETELAEDRADDVPAPANGEVADEADSEDGDRVWYVDRAGGKTGPVSPEDVPVLVGWGRITAKTLVWTAGLDGWTAAAETHLLAGDESSVAARAKQKLARAAKAAKRGARQGVEKAGEYQLGKGAVAVGQAAVDQTKQATLKAKQTLVENWPKVEDAIVENAVQLVLEGLEDDEAVTSVLDHVYENLPFPVRLGIPHGFFVRFCLERRSRIVARIKAAREAGNEKLIE